MITEDTPLWGQGFSHAKRLDLEWQYQQAFGSVTNINSLSSWTMLENLGDRYVDPDASRVGFEPAYNPDTGINLPDPPPTTD